MIGSPRLFLLGALAIAILPTWASEPPGELYPAEIRDELRSIRESLESRQSELWSVVPLVTFLLGMGAQFLIHRQKVKHDEQVARHSLIIEAQRELIQIQIKRRERLYGPLKTLLQQSKGIYDQMCQQLRSHSPERYKWEEDEESTSGMSFRTYKNGQWEIFRLLNQLPEICENEPHVLPLVNEILLIGRQIVATIRESSGLVLAEQPELSETMSNYLSHFIVLNEVWESVQKPSRNNLEYAVGVYPRALNKQVDEGYDILTKKINEWDQRIAHEASNFFKTTG